MQLGDSGTPGFHHLWSLIEVQRFEEMALQEYVSLLQRWRKFGERRVHLGGQRGLLQRRWGREVGLQLLLRERIKWHLLAVDWGRGLLAFNQDHSDNVISMFVLVGPPTVILEAGEGSFSTDWVLIQTEIAKTTKVCSYDRAGYGWSDPGPEWDTVTQVESDLNRP
jgi:hypothetical protein